ncbi:MAG: creatininase family protein, partial [Burkholderiales bacterium]
SEVYAETSLGKAGHNRPALRCKLTNWWDGARIKSLSAELFGASEGSHATCSEVSLTYFAFPEAIKQVEMSPKIAPSGPIYDSEDYRRRFPDGRIGSDPSLASAAHGARIYEAALEDIEADYKAFLDAA